MVEQPNAGSTLNPKKKRKRKPRSLSRAWIYEQLGDIHLRGLDVFEAVEVKIFKTLTDAEYLDLMKRVVEAEDLLVDGLQAPDIARVVKWRLDNLRYIVATAADPNAPDPRRRRISTDELRPLLVAAARRHNGALSFNAWLSGEAGVAAYIVCRIQSGAQKTIKPDQLEKLLNAINEQNLYNELDPIDDEQMAVARREQLDEALRPILRVLAAAATRGDGGYTPAEQQAIGDWRWMHAADWHESVVPDFTRLSDRNEILRAHFAKERGRDPEPLPERIRQRAIAILRNHQKRDRDDLTRAEKAIGRFPIDARRMYEATRGARGKNYLPEQSKPHGYPPISEDPFLPQPPD